MRNPGKEKLDTLKKSMEVGEKTLLKELVRVGEIYESREKDYQAVLNKEQEVVAKINDLSKNQRSDALNSGDSSRVVSIARYLKRLEKERLKISSILLEKEKNFLRAKERFSLLEEQLIEVRIEIKKVEKLIESKEKESRIRKEALVEQVMEDRASFGKSSE